MKRCNLLMGWQKLVVVVSLATLGIMLPMATAFVASSMLLPSLRP
jgi:hypothetical protein